MKGLYAALLMTSLLTGCIDLAVNDSKHHLRQTRCVNTYIPAEVYTMRGGLGGIFSKGMNHLQDTLIDDYGISSYSTVWYKRTQLSFSIIRQYQANHKAIILVGHSLGANEQVEVAKSLNRAHIPVALLMTVDPVMPVFIPPNVKHVVNFYKRSYVPLFSGLRVDAVNPALTQVDNVNVAEIDDVHVNHFTIDGNQSIQNLMLKHILTTLKNPKGKTSCNKKI